MIKIQRFPFTRYLIMQQVCMCNVFRELNCKQTITVSWDERLENLVLIQLLYCKRNTFSFRNHEVQRPRANRDALST